MTPPVHVRKLFLEPYQHSWIPYFLLWLLGVGISFLELIGDWLLVAVGARQRRVLFEALYLLETAQISGTILDVP